ncbi:hypothetical protein [Roseimaritima ulvae]|uniref:Uncharacterized protein n=1 Tax=Roseimaritima ulvae TaxID=980254 RepID=A0A5B9R915_9BACT|nr:hypothetical protein [Roseimaritima ulvae]QEG43233.1 hypothetical protein UC8_52790 [Roseimaritima ulvae]
MSEQNYRTIGSLCGLALGLAMMWALGIGGMIPGALFGAGGAVLGGITGERLAARRPR